MELDTTRPIHYEPDAHIKVSDIMSEMYTKEEQMEEIGKNKCHIHSMALWAPLGHLLTPRMYKDKPFIQCEYAHCMGNSLGNFADYWKHFKAHDRLCGGYIWDFADQGIKRMDQNGLPEYTYGGDWEDTPNDGTFAFNGIVRADRTPNPAFYEVKKVHQQIQFRLDGDGKLVIVNEYLFTDLNKFGLRLEALEAGRVVNSVEQDMPSVPPMQSASIDIPIQLGTNGETQLNVYAFVKEPFDVYEEGHVLAEEQFEIRGFEPKHFAKAEGKAVFDEDGAIVMECGALTAIVDKNNGFVTSIKIGGEEKLSAPIRPNFWRAQIDNDISPPGFVQSLFGKKFFKISSARLVKSNMVCKDTSVEIEWTCVPQFSSIKTVYEAGEDGLRVYLKCKNDWYSLPRFGFRMGLKTEDSVEFYGRGPHENYCDRKAAAKLGEYSGKIADFEHDYLVPQDNGNHCDARYLRVGGEGGLRFEAENKPFEFSVHDYTQEELDEATHANRLKHGECIEVCIDGAQRGVGGDVPALACTKKQYKILPFRYHEFSFIIK